MQVKSTLVVLALGLDGALSQPHNRHAHHPKRQVDYNNANLYSGVKWDDIGVDWNKVNYGGNHDAKAAPIAAPAPTPAAPVVVQQPGPSSAAPSQSPAPVVDQSSSSGSGGSAGGSPGGSKRGLCYNFGTPSLDMFSGYAGKTISWGWNWDSSPWKMIGGLSYVPTLQALKPESTGPWQANAQKAIASANGGPVYLMGFNEPDIAEQANLSPAAAAQAWNQYMTPLKGNNVKFGSPQVSNGVGTNPATGNAYGLEWLTQFVAACSGCQIDFFVVHWYGCTDGCSIDTDFAAFKTFVGQAKNLAGGKKIWITEFGTHNADKAGFIKQALPFLDGEDAVERYAYFMVQEGDLLSGTALSPAGQAYVA